MINCPKCGHPVSGRARSCGYCGESLVNNYFAREERHKGKDPLLEAPAGAAGICAMVLGIFGCLALLAALAFQLMVMFGYGGSVPPEIELVDPHPCACGAIGGPAGAGVDPRREQGRIAVRQFLAVCLWLRTDPDDTVLYRQGIRIVF